ncbi:MAG: hypothetical protein IK016_00605 [Lachnospiraceae bacterium]|nr:hypothetical protein [Lachnospiraceae bacterium]
MSDTNTYTVIYMEEIEWDAVPKAEIRLTPWAAHPLCYPAYAQLAVAADALHVRLFAEEAQPLSRVTEDNAPVHLDSCLEFFIEPEPGKGYWNFEANPAGAFKAAFGEGRGNRTRLQTDVPYRSFFRIETEQDGTGWGIRYAVPLTLLFPEGTCPAEARCNFYKCGDETATPHFQCWNHIATPAPDFHRPEYFGTLRFSPMRRILS